MTTTLLEDRQVDYLRSIKKSAVILLAMGLIDASHPGRAVKESELQDILSIDPRTLRGHLGDLCARNSLIFNGIGYVLAEGGRANFLPAHSESIEAHQALVSPQAHQVLELDHSAADAKIAQPAQNVLHTMCALKKEEEDSLILREIDSSSTLLDAQNALTLERVDGRPLNNAEILAATPLLDGFGETGVVTARLDLRTLDPRLVLGWIAQAFTERTRVPDRPRGIDRPANFVYSHLRATDPAKPRERYHINPLAYLPDHYLEVLGLITYPCDHCEAVFTQRAQLDAHAVAEHPRAASEEETTQPGPQLDLAHVQAVINGRMSAEQAWEQVLDGLRTEMAKASFETWLRDTKAIDYQNRMLTIGCRNGYARDWLASRILADMDTAYGLIRGASFRLVEALGISVTVKFVVYAEENDDE